MTKPATVAGNTSATTAAAAAAAAAAEASQAVDTRDKDVDGDGDGDGDFTALKLTNQIRQHDSELNETSTESKTLRQQIVALKASRDEAIAENGRLMDKLTDAQVEARTLQKKLRESELKVANMNEQLHNYVQEVKKAEDLLMQKVSLVI
ncbi:GL24738 [Drosophila persimilis]|uniref:GL24738 n=1 Tax=Drosophila persimilis TaxID=7234 RepID=B4GUE8_DROPE|nr:GL24738 [Drosophila persimilis]